MYSLFSSTNWKWPTYWSKHTTQSVLSICFVQRKESWNYVHIERFQTKLLRDLQKCWICLSKLWKTSDFDTKKHCLCQQLPWIEKNRYRRKLRYKGMKDTAYDLRNQFTVNVVFRLSISWWWLRNSFYGFFCTKFTLRKTSLLISPRKSLLVHQPIKSNHLKIGFID